MRLCVLPLALAHPRSSYGRLLEDAIRLTVSYEDPPFARFLER